MSAEQPEIPEWARTAAREALDEIWPGEKSGTARAERVIARALLSAGVYGGPKGWKGWRSDMSDMRERLRRAIKSAELDHPKASGDAYCDLMIDALLAELCEPPPRRCWRAMLDSARS